MSVTNEALWVPRLQSSFPTVTKVMGSRLEERLSHWAGLILDELGPWADGVKGISRPWALLLLSGVGDPRFEDRDRIKKLEWCEQGLTAIKANGGKLGPWRRRLEADEGGFAGSIAELLVISKLARSGAPMKFEVPSGREGSGTNFDVQLDLDTGVEVHLEVKQREETPLGKPNRASEVGLARLLECDVPSDADLRIRPRNKDLLGDELLDAALLVDECIRVLRGEGKEIADVTQEIARQKRFPNALFRPCSRALSKGREVKLVHLHAGDSRLETEAAFIPEARAVFVARGPVDSVRLWAGTGHVFLDGLIERRPLYGRQTREAFGDAQRFDYPNSEADKIRDLLSAVPSQLPDEPFNVLVLVTVSDSQWVDIEIALRGDPQPGQAARVGGLFSRSAWQGVSGVAVLCSPHTESLPSVRWCGNPQATFALASHARRALLGSLTASTDNQPQASEG